MLTSYRNLFTLIAVITLALASVGCGQKKLDALERQKAALLAEQTTQDSVLAQFVSTFDLVEENLSQIRQREDSMFMPLAENERIGDRQSQAVAGVAWIDEKLEENRLIIEALEQQISGQAPELRTLRNSVARLRKEMKAKDEEVATLKTQIEDQDLLAQTIAMRMDTLGQQNDQLARMRGDYSARLAIQDTALSDQAATLSALDTELTTAYVITGTAKELKQKKIIESLGGFLGIGSTKQLDANADLSHFKEVDINEFRSLSMDARKVEVLTPHPSAAFTLREGDSKKVQDLEITDPAQFWQQSKYLVVVLN